MGRRQISEVVQAHLRGFTERQRERAAKRRKQLAASLGSELPDFYYNRQPGFPIQLGKAAATFETPWTHHTHVEIREALAK
jgi:molybdopterin-biosynthesis enzyme MoeA-like protein